MIYLKDITSWEQCINQVVCGDCLEGMKLIPSDSIDLVVTDPPYDMDLQGGMRGHYMSMEKYKGNDLDSICNGFDIDVIFRECERVCKKFNMFCFCSNKQVSDIMRFGENNGYITNLLVRTRGAIKVTESNRFITLGTQEKEYRFLVFSESLLYGYYSFASCFFQGKV